MNNTELLKAFQKAAENTNPFDCIIALKSLKPLYKKSEFYKATKLNIFKAYEMYSKMQLPNALSKINQILESDNLAMFINEMAYEIDLTPIIDKLLYGINYENLAELIQKFMPEMSIDDLKGMASELRKSVEKLKD